MSEPDVRHVRLSRLKAVVNHQLASPAVSLPSSTSTSPSPSSSAQSPATPHPHLPLPLPVYLPHRVNSPVDEEIVQTVDSATASTSTPYPRGSSPSADSASLPLRSQRRQLSSDSTAATYPLPSPRTAGRNLSRSSTASSSSSTSFSSSPLLMLHSLVSRVDSSHAVDEDEDEDDVSAAREKTSLLRHSPLPPAAALKSPPPSLQLTPSVSLSISKRSGSPSLSPTSGTSSRPSSGHPMLRRSVSVSSSRAAALNLHDKSRIPLSHILALSCYWFGWSFLWLPLLIVIVPTQAKQFVGDEVKGAALSQILMLGSVVSVVAAPLLGSYSDSCTHSYGRRRPFMIVGTVLASVSLLLLAVAPSLSFFSLAFALLSFSNNMIIAPYSALVPDIVPLEQRGLASGYLGLFSMLGNLAGGMLGSLQSTLGLPVVYLLLLSVHGGCMWVTCRWTVEEQLVLEEYEQMSGKYTTALDGPRPPPTGCSRAISLFKPFFSHDFRVVFFTRFVMQLGVLTVQEYLLYYLSDEIGARMEGSSEQHFTAFGTLMARSDEQAVTLLFGPVLFGAIISSVIAGLLSDWMGGKRKKLIYVSGGIMCASGFLFAVTRSYSVDLLLGGLFGLGFGAFSVLDWALAADVLPDPSAHTAPHRTAPHAVSRSLLPSDAHGRLGATCWYLCLQGAVRQGHGAVVARSGDAAGAGSAAGRRSAGCVCERGPAQLGLFDYILDGCAVLLVGNCICQITRRSRLTVAIHSPHCELSRPRTACYHFPDCWSEASLGNE